MNPSESRRERQKQAVRTQILDAARELFAAHGYEAVTLRKIAEKVEYSPAAIYLHFEDKDALFRELMAHDLGAFAERLLRLERVADPVERLARAAHAYLDFALERPNHYRLLFMTARPHASEGDPGGAYTFIRAGVAEAIAAGRLREGLKNADAVAQTLWAGVHGVAALHIALCVDSKIPWRPVRERARLMIDVLLRGLEK